MKINIRVQPRAKRNRLIKMNRQAGQLGDEWKLQLTAPPVDGKANQACIEFFARGLRIPRSRVRLLSGEKSRHKLLELDGVSEAEFLRFAAGDESVSEECIRAATVMERSQPHGKFSNLWDRSLAARRPRGSGPQGGHGSDGYPLRQCEPLIFRASVYCGITSK